MYVAGDVTWREVKPSGLVYMFATCRSSGQQELQVLSWPVTHLSRADAVLPLQLPSFNWYLMPDEHPMTCGSAKKR
jgi:hypothetical protein